MKPIVGRNNQIREHFDARNELTPQKDDLEQGSLWSDSNIDSAKQEAGPADLTINTSRKAALMDIFLAINHDHNDGMLRKHQIKLHLLEKEWFKKLFKENYQQENHENLIQELMKLKYENQEKEKNNNIQNQPLKKQSKVQKSVQNDQPKEDDAGKYTVKPDDPTFWDEQRKLVKEDFITFEEFQQYFIQCGIISQVEEIAKKLYYEQNFTSFLGKAFCYKKQIREKRIGNMKKRIEMLEEETNSANMAEEGEQKDGCCGRIKKNLNDNGELYFSVLSSANTSLVSLFDEVTDWLLFYRTYRISMKPQNNSSMSYKIVLVSLAMTIVSTYLLRYSALISLHSDTDLYSNKRMSHQSKFEKIRNYMLFTIVGPFLFLIAEILDSAKKVIRLFTFFLGCRIDIIVQNIFEWLIKAVIGLDPIQQDSVYQQKQIGQLFFESFPNILLQSLIVSNVLKCQELVDDKEGKRAILLSFISAVYSLLLTTLRKYSECKTVKEPFTLYLLNILNARRLWVPFIHQIKDGDIRRAVKFGKIDVYIPVLSPKLGVYSSLNYRFSDNSLKEFTNELQDMDKNHFIDVFNLNDSVEKNSITHVLHYLQRRPKDFYDSNLVQTLNKKDEEEEKEGWFKLIRNAHDNQFMGKNGGKDVMKKDLWNAQTPAGREILFICAENEENYKEGIQKENPKWELKQCFKTLTEGKVKINGKTIKFDVDIHCNQQNETLLTYSITHRKLKTFEMIKDYCDLNRKNKQNGETPLGLAVRIRCKKFVELLLENVKFVNTKNDIKTNEEQKTNCIENCSQPIRSCFKKNDNEDQNEKTDDKKDQNELDFRKQRISVDQGKRSITLFEYLCGKIVEVGTGKLTEIDKLLYQKFNKIDKVDFMEIFDVDMKKEDQSAVAFIREVAKLMSESYKNEENYSKKINDLLQLQKKSKIPKYRFSENEMNMKEVAFKYQEDEEVSFATYKQLLFDEIWKQQKGQMKNFKGGTFYNVVTYLEKFSEYIPVEADSKTNQKEKEKELKCKHIVEEWKKFIDHDKILEILKNINEEGETEDQKQFKANIIDIIQNYSEVEFDPVEDYDILREVHEWLFSNFMKDDDKGKGSHTCHTYMEVLEVLEKKLMNFKKDQIFKYHERKIRKNNEQMEEMGILLKLYEKHGKSTKKIEQEQKKKMKNRIKGRAQKTDQEKDQTAVDKQNKISEASENENGGGDNNDQKPAKRDLKTDEPNQHQKDEIKKQLKDHLEQNNNGKLFHVEKIEHFKRQNHTNHERKVRDNNKKRRRQSCFGFGKTDQLFFVLQEVISGLDFISDIWVLNVYINSGHNAWLVINIMSIVSPIFVSYVTLVTLIIKNYYRERTKNKMSTVSCRKKYYQNFKNFIPLTPIVVFYLGFIEIVFLINSIIIVPIVYLLKCFTRGKCDDQFKCIQLSFKKLYDILFDMNHSEVDGFRRLRSITQLTFESFTQIILQIRILEYQRNHQNDSDYLGISEQTIRFSLLCAVLHATTEALSLIGEKIAFRSESYTHYISTCFNCRYGFVPYANILKANKENFDDDEEVDKNNQQQEEQDEKNKVLSYEQFQYFGVGSPIEYKFSEETFGILTREIASMPKVQDQNERLILRLGESIQDIKMNKVVDLLLKSQGKIEVKIQDDILEKIITRDVEEFKENMKQNAEKNKMKPIINKLVEKEQLQIVEKMIKLGAYVDFQYKDKNQSIVERAIKGEQIKFRRTMGALLSTNDKELLKFVEDKLQEQESGNSMKRMNQIIQDGDVREIKAIALCNSPLDQMNQNELKLKALEWIKQDIEAQYAKNKDKEAHYKPQTPKALDALRILAFIYGQNLRIEEKQTKLKNSEKKLYSYLENEYVKKFEQVEDVEFSYKNQTFTLHVTEWTIFNKLRQKVIDQLFDEDKKEGFKFAEQISPIKIDDLKVSSNKIFDIVDIICKRKKVGQIKPQKITQLDEYVRLLGLDKDFELYYGNSREICTKKNMLKITIKGHDVEGEATQQTYKDIDKKGDYIQKSSITLKFLELKNKPACFSQISYYFELQDQESGETQCSSLALDTQIKRSFSSTMLHLADRNTKIYPQYGQVIDTDFIQQEKEGSMKFKDVFGDLLNVEKLEFKGRTRNEPGNKFKLRNFYLQFIVNYPYGTNIDQAKKDLEAMLEKEHQALYQEKKESEAMLEKEHQALDQEKKESEAMLEKEHQALSFSHDKSDENYNWEN